MKTNKTTKTERTYWEEGYVTDHWTGEVRKVRRLVRETADGFEVLRVVPQ